MRCTTSILLLGLLTAAAGAEEVAQVDAPRTGMSIAELAESIGTGATINPPAGVCRAMQFDSSRARVTHSAPTDILWQ